MKFQLVTQFPEELYDDLDWIAEMEDKLDECLVDAEVDGHDIGNGEINIFIHTNNPIDTFEVTKNILNEDNSVLKNAKIAYRSLDGDSYIGLWPQDLVEFNVT